jgi:predicted nucleic acid-binding protein
MILDSNIIIYSALPENKFLIEIFTKNDVKTSAITFVEVLGYFKLDPSDEAFFKQIFNTIPVLDIDSEIILKATKIRKAHNMTLGDAIVAATALQYQLPLMTRNIRDFQHLPDLVIVNPFATKQYIRMQRS